MPDFDQLIHQSATAERQILEKDLAEKRSFSDHFALAVTTFGVGYLPLAPGTWGSMVGVGIYLLFGLAEEKALAGLGPKGWSEPQVEAWVHAANLIVFLLFCLLGVWAANRATRLFKNKDPQQAVVDEVIGQLIVFLFIPFGTEWYFVLAGFLLFRLFDIWKPWLVGLADARGDADGVMIDDLWAGLFAGIAVFAGGVLYHGVFLL